MSRYRIADDVAWVSHEELDAHELPSAYVTLLPHGQPTTLEGPACVVWLALAEGGSHDEIAATAALMWGIDPDEIRDDVIVLVDELVALGLATTE